jgi:ribonuclease HI
MAELNTVYMVWIPGHWGNEGNEITYQFTAMELNIHLYDLS